MPTPPKLWETADHKPISKYIDGIPHGIDCPECPCEKTCLEGTCPLWCNDGFGCNKFIIEVPPNFVESSCNDEWAGRFALTGEGCVWTYRFSGPGEGAGWDLMILEDAGSVYMVLTLGPYAATTCGFNWVYFRRRLGPTGNTNCHRFFRNGRMTLPLESINLGGDGCMSCNFTDYTFGHATIIIP